jgi:hypothetical protein
MTTITRNYSINNSLSAVTTFNGVTLNNITSTAGDNIINLHHNLTPTAFEGLFYTTLLNVGGIVASTPLTDPCVDAYGVSWKWSTFKGCSSPATMPLNTFTHKPSTWENVRCGKSYEKRWIKEPHVQPSTTTITTVLCGCDKDYVIWNLSTKNWSVSTSLGSEINKFPYFLKYSQDGLSPYTFSLEKDTVLNVKVCQDVKCESVFNTITFFTDQGTMSQMHSEIVNIVDTVIKPRAINYFTATNHLITDINDIIKVQPTNEDKRYLKTLMSNGYQTLSSDGTSNIYLLFTDSPSAYTVSCTNPAKTGTYDTDISTFKTFLSGAPSPDFYKATILATTYANNVDRCPAFTSHLSSVQTGIGSNYTPQGSLVEFNSNIKYKHQVLYKGTGVVNPDATTAYYTDLILNSLHEQGIDLINYTPNVKRTTLCESLTAIVKAAPYVKIYTPNRFVLAGREVKFENLTTNISSLLSIKIDYGDGTVQTFTGTNMYLDFKKIYNTAGYKTLNITTTTVNGSVRVQTFANIVKVVNFYD